LDSADPTAVASFESQITILGNSNGTPTNIPRTNASSRNISTDFLGRFLVEGGLLLLLGDSSQY